ncbi:hypothetical protein D3C81_1687090 [compost metagenome]
MRSIVEGDRSAVGGNHPARQHQRGGEGTAQQGRQRQTIVRDHEWAESHLRIGQCVENRGLAFAHGLATDLNPHAIEVDKVFMHQCKHCLYIAAIEGCRGALRIVVGASSHTVHSRCFKGQ